MTLSALGVFLAARPDDGGPPLSVVVAGADLPAGHVLTEADLRVVGADLSADTASRTFAASGDLVGAITLTPIARGEIVQAGAVVAGSGSPDARLEVTFPVEVAHAPPALARGEHVAVLATTGSTDDARTTVVVDDALVVEYRLDATTLGADAAVLTLAVDSPAEVLAATGASHTAHVSVVRTTGADTTFADQAAAPLPGGAGS